MKIENEVQSFFSKHNASDDDSQLLLPLIIEGWVRSTYSLTIPMEGNTLVIAAYMPLAFYKKYGIYLAVNIIDFNRGQQTPLLQTDEL
jgi:hypothetical protein